MGAIFFYKRGEQILTMLQRKEVVTEEKIESK
jgi:hypothetical protein